MPTNPKIAIFDLTGCEGCQIHLLSLDEYLMNFWQDFDIVNWRLMSDNDRQSVDFDIAVIEGAATTDKHIKLLRQIRKTSKIVIALGACAVTGNVFAQLSPAMRQKLAPKIYDDHYKLKAKFLEPIENFIKVDAKIQGCPPDINAFKTLLAKIKNQPIKSLIKKVPLPDYTAKIEGHGILKINFAHKKASFTVEESERLVEGLVLGKNYHLAPAITARICGICPIAHNLSSWTAIEDAIKFKISPETIILRRILLASQIIKSHLLHLFFLVLPDYAGVKGGVELSKKYPAEFHLMLNIKRLSDRALIVVGGSNSFPTNTVLGGFKNIPKQKDLLSLAEEIGNVIDEAEDLLALFANIRAPDINIKTKLVASEPMDNNYPSYPSKLNINIKEFVQPESTSKLGVLSNGEVFKVGAMTRLSHYANRLNPIAKKAFQSISFKQYNPYHNNLAQAVEILHFLEDISLLIYKLKEKDIVQAKAPKKIKIKDSELGKSCLEAPRGILIHQVKLDPQGIIKYYNIIPPTQINLASLEKEAQVLIQRSTSKSQAKQKKLVEKLIRAFDPCITCAVH